MRINLPATTGRGLGEEVGYRPARQQRIQGRGTSSGSPSTLLWEGRPWGPVQVSGLLKVVLLEI